jgi:hypothetical protein
MTNQSPTTLSEIISIVKEEDLLNSFKLFEEHVNAKLVDVTYLLRTKMSTTDMVYAMDHMVTLSSNRDLVAQLNALAKTFVEHCQSSHFMLFAKPGAPTHKASESDRGAHFKKLSAGFKGMYEMLQEKLKSIDERVNICKLILRQLGESK